MNDRQRPPGANSRSLDILRRYLPDAAVDLVYLDPPFNSNRDDNVIFRDESGNATTELPSPRLERCRRPDRPDP
jgi:16S rRNA G966 N2-methylase RsmD